MASPRKLRWYQLSLRRLAIAVAIVAAGMAFYASSIRPYWVQAEVHQEILDAGGTCDLSPAPAWAQFFLGPKNAKKIVAIDLAAADPSPTLLLRIAKLPQLKVLTLGGETITDSTLGDVPTTETLQGLVLDSTWVTDAAIDRLRQQRSGLFVVRSDARIATTLDNRAIGLLKEMHACPLGVARYLKSEGVFEITSVGEPNRRGLGGLIKSYVLLVDGDSNWLERLHRLEKLQMYAGLGFTRTPSADAEWSRVMQLGRLKWIGGEWRLRADQLKELNRLTNLEAISAPNLPNLTDDVIAAWDNLTRLKELAIADSAVVSASAWPEFPLETLDVSGTALGDESVATLAKYPRLKTLVLAETALTDAGAAALRDLPNLETLNVHGTRVTTASLAALHALPKLTTLEASADWGESLGDAKSKLAGGFRELTASDFIDTAAGFRDRIAQLESSESSLRVSPAESLHVEVLAGNQNLRSVDANGSCVDDDGLRVLATLPNLESLALSGTWVTDAGLESLTDLKQLKELDLTNTRVTDVGLAIIARIPTLEYIAVPEGTRAAGLLAIEKLPKLKLIQLYSVGGRWVSPKYQNRPWNDEDLDAAMAVAERTMQAIRAGDRKEILAHKFCYWSSGSLHDFTVTGEPTAEEFVSSFIYGQTFTAHAARRLRYPEYVRVLPAEPGN